MSQKALFIQLIIFLQIVFLLVGVLSTEKINIKKN